MENSEIKTGKKIFIRSAGKDEYWLQNIIYETPSILGLGDLLPMIKERKQASGGKLDILLKDPSDSSMYEVEVMLGETDPSHIIRSIEYYDIEKRRYPQRQHFPVLIAESFERRYFNVIQILSLNIPMIAIQADLIEVDGQRILNFTKILNIYQEPSDDENETIIATEGTWLTKAPWVLQLAKNLVSIINRTDNLLTLNYTQSYVALITNKGNAYWLYKRSEPNAHLGFKEADDEKSGIIKELLDKVGILHSFTKSKEFFVVINPHFLKTHNEILTQINNIRFPTENIVE